MVLGAATGFGTIGIFGELAATADLELATLLPVRFVLSSLVVLLVAFGRSWPIPASRRVWATTLGLGVVYTAMTLFYFVSLRYLTAGVATIVLYTYPSFVFVLSVAFLRETVGARTVMALVLSLGGVSLVVGTDTAGVRPGGVALALAAAGCYAVYTAGSRSLVAHLDPRQLLVGVLLGTTGSMLVYGVLAGPPGVPAGRGEWGIVVGLVVVGTAVPLLLFYEGVERLSASHVGVVSTAEPLVAVVLGVFFLDEPVTGGLLVGGILILAGVVLVQRMRTESRPAQRKPVGGTE